MLLWDAMWYGSLAATLHAVWFGCGEFIASSSCDEVELSQLTSLDVLPGVTGRVAIVIGILADGLL